MSRSADQSLPDHMPSSVTLREVFTRYLDITAVPKRSFFIFLRHSATDSLEQERLDEFLSEEGAVRNNPQISILLLIHYPRMNFTSIVNE